MVRTAFIISALFVLVGCATSESGHPMTAEAARAAEIADLLTRTAAARPDRIRSAGAELAALELALLDDASFEYGYAPEPVEAEPAPPPAPDLTGARSLLSAVHLASYRNLRNAEAGWSELQGAQSEALAGLEPRLAEADLGERGVFLRLKAGPLDSPEAAAALCARLEAAGHWCAPIDFNGRMLHSSES